MGMREGIGEGGSKGFYGIVLIRSKQRDWQFVNKDWKLYYFEMIFK